MTNYDFLIESISEATDDCLIWPHCKSHNGYGKVKVDGKMHGTHRVALQLTKPAPVGKVCSIRGDWVPAHRLEAAHGPCHERACFNPSHLAWKTHAENMRDKKRDGTDAMPADEDHYMCRLPNADIASIFQLWEGPYRGPNRTGPTQQELADQFGCAQAYISDIVNGRYRT